MNPVPQPRQAIGEEDFPPGDSSPGGRPENGGHPPAAGLSGGSLEAATMQDLLGLEATERLLIRVLKDMRARYRNAEDVQLRHLLLPLGPRCAALGSALLALPFIWPATLGPLSFVVFVLISLMSWQLLQGREEVVLPERFLRISIPIKVFRLLTRFLVILIRWKRTVCRPRLRRLVAGRTGRRLCAAAMTVGGALIAVPLPLVPFMNTFPALGVVLVGVGWVEQDGLLTILGLICLLIGAVLIFSVIAALVFFGMEAFFWISEELEELDNFANGIGNGNGVAEGE